MADGVEWQRGRVDLDTLVSKSAEVDIIPELVGQHLCCLSRGLARTGRVTIGSASRSVPQLAGQARSDQVRGGGGVGRGEGGVYLQTN